jgi:hypothetical protein
MLLEVELDIGVLLDYFEDLYVELVTMHQLLRCGVSYLDSFRYNLRAHCELLRSSAKRGKELYTSGPTPSPAVNRVSV